MTPWQCRDARNLLKWSQEDLAAASRVPVEIVANFEAGELVGMLHLQLRMRDEMEAVGIGFPFTIERGEFMPAAITYSPPDRRETH